MAIQRFISGWPPTIHNSSSGCVEGGVSLFLSGLSVGIVSASSGRNWLNSQVPNPAAAGAALSHSQSRLGQITASQAGDCRAVRTGENAETCLM